LEIPKSLTLECNDIVLKMAPCGVFVVVLVLVVVLKNKTTKKKKNPSVSLVSL
jgi:hypothetical protein